MCAKIVEIPKQITEQTEHFQLVCKNSSLTGLICYTHFHAAKIMLSFFILGLDTYLQVCHVVPHSGTTHALWRLGVSIRCVQKK